MKVPITESANRKPDIGVEHNPDEPEPEAKMKYQLNLNIVL
jgi:hypothetical protein